jgi:hypothetical protein
LAQTLAVDVRQAPPASRKVRHNPRILRASPAPSFLF